jgi:hypothetical protein
MLALPILLTGCAMTVGGGTETGRALCDQFRPMRWSKFDTPDTVEQAKAHNRVGAAVCGWRP